MKLAITLTALLGTAACTGTIGGGAGDGVDGGDDTSGSIAIITPTIGSTHVRDAVGMFGEIVARVEVEVDANGSIARVEIEDDDGVHLATLGADNAATIELPLDGSTTLVANGYAGNNTLVATDSVVVNVDPPDVSTCYDWLDLYTIDYTLGPNRQGVSDPVTVTTPINGVMYRYTSNTSQRDTFFMDCSLAVSLAKAAPFYRKRDIIEVADYGVYNYRCIGEGEPPNCPNGMSQHAYAKGIDIAGYTTGDGEYYSINDDWVIDPESETTCTAGTEPGKDQFLHELICDLKAAAVWNIVLTPNYNSAHRNHFHVDLTNGSNFIRSGVVDVDHGPDHH
jgi:hypothetical protein